MEHIAISVIVPIYNTKPYLAECIESILAQKINVPIEVLLIDDGSTDGCGEVCDKYAARDERVRVIHQENQGLSAARNAGIDAAKGRYYSFIDSDDVVLPRFLQTLYDACEEHDAYMSLCSVEDVQEDGKSCDPAYFTRPHAGGCFLRQGPAERVLHPLRHGLHRRVEQDVPRRGLETAALPRRPPA